MAHVSKGKVTFSLFSPKKVGFEKYEKARYRVGMIIGKASAISERTDDRTGEVYKGLRGAFRAFIGNDATPASTDSVSSGICYMPEAWQGPIMDALETMKAEGVIGGQVSFVYDVYIGRRGEDGYEWIVEDLRPAQMDDPLALLAKEAAPMTAIAAPTAAEPAKK